jgi:hypothetical protein
MRGAVNPRRVVLTAATASVAVLAGMLPGTPSAASGPDGAVEIAYTCAFTTGGADDGTAPVTEDATVTVQQSYPASAVAGESFRPGALTVEVALDKDAAGAVLPAGTTAATATASLTARVTQGSSAADARWPGLRAATAPATDGLDLTFTGDAGELSVTAPGTVRFDAGQLDLVVYAQTPAGGSPSGPGPSDTATPATPETASGTSDAAASGPAPEYGAGALPPAAAGTVSGTVTAACTVKDGQATGLGTVDVAAPGASAPAGSGTPAPAASSGTPAGAATAAAGRGGDVARHGTIDVAEPPHSGVNDCPPAPAMDPDQDYLDSLPRPPDVFYINIDPEYRLPECTFITGLSNVGKLNGAATVNGLDDHPALTRIVQTAFYSTPTGSYTEFDSVAQLDLPPAHSTFLTFGFMPTTAVMTMKQLGPLTLTIIGSSMPVTTTTTTIVGKLDLRLSDIEINGTPLDVGANCHTVRPLDLELVGVDRSHSVDPEGHLTPSDYNEIEGGPLHQDQLTIPPFTGCTAHGDNVDALLTASISGPDNSLNFIQAGLCIPASREYSHCDPEIPYPTPPHR